MMKEKINPESNVPGGMSVEMTTFEKVSQKECLHFPVVQPYKSMKNISAGGGVWDVSWEIKEVCDVPVTNKSSTTYEGTVTFQVESGSAKNVQAAISVSIEQWSVNNYVMMPAAVYNGNRYRVKKTKYPPFIHEEDGIGVDMPVTITDVPHLSLHEGESKIHLRSGDMATPCICFYSPAKSEGFILLGEHMTSCGYTGWSIEESADRQSAIIRLEAPAVREEMYQMCDSMVPSDDKAVDMKAGESVKLHFRLVQFCCESIPDLFRKYVEIREDLSGKPVFSHTVPLQHAFRLIENKFNASQWNDKYGYYMTSPDGAGTKFGDWQAGWCGSGMHTLAFLADGEVKSKEYSKQTWDAVFGILQLDNGWIKPIVSDGKSLGDDFCHESNTGTMLIRKNADILLFAGRHIALLLKRGEKIPERWMQGYRKLADAFVRIWKKYGQFGQFIDMSRDVILQGGTVSGGIAPGGLVLAWKLTGIEEYLDTAVQSAEYYHRNFVKKGLMNGGPGEILQNPDSESAFGLLESFVEMYEITGDTGWLPMAEDCAYQCMSWCVSYDFSFPSDSVFGILDMKTAGSVYANTQNKHSAPGICTLSGVSLLKLYRATGNDHWLVLLQSIAHNITQYLSRPDRLIPTWEGHDGTEPPDGTINGNLLPSGCMCERVNMCDWETKKNIGGIFNGSCWCETSLLLTYTEVPGVLFFSDTGEVYVFDHIEVAVKDNGNEWELELYNPTRYDTAIKVLIETHDHCKKALGDVWYEEQNAMEVTAGNRKKITVMKGV